MMMIYCRTV